MSVITVYRSAERGAGICQVIPVRNYQVTISGAGVVFTPSEDSSDNLNFLQFKAGDEIWIPVVDVQSIVTPKAERR